MRAAAIVEPGWIEAGECILSEEERVVKVLDELDRSNGELSQLIVEG
ncbi:MULTISPECIES: hypothetical protein [Rhizobium]|nr:MULTISPECIES: hypothetical protein [Rhizobium]